MSDYVIMGLAMSPEDHQVLGHLAVEPGSGLAQFISPFGAPHLSVKAFPDNWGNVPYKSFFGETWPFAAANALELLRTPPKGMAEWQLRAAIAAVAAHVVLVAVDQVASSSQDVLQVLSFIRLTNKKIVGVYPREDRGPVDGFFLGQMDVVVPVRGSEPPGLLQRVLEMAAKGE